MERLRSHSHASDEAGAAYMTAVHHVVATAGEFFKGLARLGVLSRDLLSQNTAPDSGLHSPAREMRLERWLTAILLDNDDSGPKDFAEDEQYFTDQTLRETRTTLARKAEVIAEIEDPNERAEALKLALRRDATATTTDIGNFVCTLVDDLKSAGKLKG